METILPRKKTALKDNPPLHEKQYFLISKVSPESRQHHDVYGIKLHDMCGSENEARDLASYYHKLDPDFDVLVGVTGRMVSLDLF